MAYQWNGQPAQMGYDPAMIVHDRPAQPQPCAPTSAGPVHPNQQPYQGHAQEYFQSQQAYAQPNASYAQQPQAHHAQAYAPQHTYQLPSHFLPTPTSAHPPSHAYPNVFNTLLHPPPGPPDPSLLLAAYALPSALPSSSVLDHLGSLRLSSPAHARNAYTPPEWQAGMDLGRAVSQPGWDGVDAGLAEAMRREHERGLGRMPHIHVPDYYRSPAPTSSPHATGPHPAPSSIASVLLPQIPYTAPSTFPASAGFTAHSSASSPAYLSTLLQSTLSSLAAQPAPQQEPVSTPHAHRFATHTPTESPDPLLLRSGGLQPTPSPQKRKSASDLRESPIVKRLNGGGEVKTPSKQRVTIRVPARKLAEAGKASTPGHRAGSARELEEEELEEEEDEIEMLEASSAPGTGGKRALSTPKSTGADRSALDKLTSYIEDIFEAEDSLSPGAPPHPFHATFFSPFSPPPDAQEYCQPQLSAASIKKLAKLVGGVARWRRAGLADLGRGEQENGEGEDGTVAMLGRLLRILGRSVRRGGEGLMVWGEAAPAPARKTPKGKKKPPAAASTPKKQQRGRQPTATPGSGSHLRRSSRSTSSSQRSSGTGEEEREEEAEEEDEEDAEDSPAKGRGRSGQDVTDEMLDRFEDDVKKAAEAVLAADCTLAILNAERLPKQLYSEDLITACLGTLKHHLSKTIYPYVETISDSYPDPTPLLTHLASPGPSVPASTKALRALLCEVFQALTSALARVHVLVTTKADVGLSESIVIPAAFVAVGPFFVVDPPESGKGAQAARAPLGALGGPAGMRGLRLEAMKLVRGIFAKHEAQRSWIIEEIMTSLVKLPDIKKHKRQFQLRDGRAIHTVSALLLQLVQSCAHGVRSSVRRLRKKRTAATAAGGEEADDTPKVKGKAKDRAGEQPARLLSEEDLQELAIWTKGLESAMRSAQSIVIYLMQRSTSSKTNKNSHEADFRAILDNLVTDALTVLYWPEWPAASLLLIVLIKNMMKALDDPKSSGEASAAKGIALDHLGPIAAKLREVALRQSAAVKTEDGEEVQAPLKPVEGIICDVDSEALHRLSETHKAVFAYLSRSAGEDQASESALELSGALWGQDIANALKQCQSILEKMDAAAADAAARAEAEAFRSLGSQLRAHLSAIWTKSDREKANVFEVANDDAAVRVDALSERLSTVQALQSAQEQVLARILSSLQATSVQFRTKALKALNQLVTCDPDVLRNPAVRSNIEYRLSDVSPAVRDAAIELVGKYIVQEPELADEYYPRISERIADTGLSVRKRVIKLLRSIYLSTSDQQRRIDIGRRLSQRMMDEDDNVKELAVKTLEELWFSDGMPHTPSKRRGSAQDNAVATSDTALATATTLMGVAGKFRERQSPLEGVLQAIIKGKDGKPSPGVRARYEEVSNALIDSLDGSADDPGFDTVNCIRAVYFLSVAEPELIKSSRAETLLPYLTAGSSDNERAISDVLLKIFRACVPRMPKSSTRFAAELQRKLLPMVSKPSNGLASLQETVACLCAVVNGHTHAFDVLVRMLKTVNGQLQQLLAKAKNGEKLSDPRPATLLLLIIGLLVEHCDFDQVRKDDLNVAAELNNISQGRIAEHVYNVLIQCRRFAPNVQLQMIALQSLGCVFRAHPVLMTQDSSLELMDAVFASTNGPDRARLLKVIQEYLLADSTKRDAASVEDTTAGAVDMKLLVGNADGFAESGVSASIIQRYLDHILVAARSDQPALQQPALDIMSFTIKQGLAHPLQCLPTIIALETSAESALSSKVFGLHSILHTKHASIINNRFEECATSAFDFQSARAKGATVRGYRIDGETVNALVSRWYGLVREKRAWRLEFLKATTKAFDIDPERTPCTQRDIDLTRFIAENIAALEFKTQEEVLIVARLLTTYLSNMGEQVRQTLSDLAPSDGMEVDGDEAGTVDDPHLLSTVRASVVLGIALLLKAQLKQLYGLNEKRCLEYVPNKKTAFGDRPATRKADGSPVLQYDRMPFADRPLQTLADIYVQQEAFLKMLEEELPEPMDEEDEP